MKIGLLGGSFNPPHDGHRHISLIAMKRLQLDRIWWIVTPGNPLKSHDELASLSDRVQMCRKIANHPRIDITDFESVRQSPYTAETLAYLKKRCPQTRFIWLMGTDNLKSFHRWKHWRKILNLTPIAVLDRPSYRFSATSSRFAIAAGDSQIPERLSTRLAYKTPPVWTMITSKLCSLSSTEIRSKNKNK